MRTLLTKDINRQSVSIQSSVQRATDQGERAPQLRTERRSSKYLQCLAKPDAAGTNQLDATEVVEAVLSEFALGETVPIGCLAECYLGVPYQVHVLDLAGGIVEHYHVSQPLPMPFERARRLALHEAYVAIEVYSDHLVCIRADGTTVGIDQ